MRAVLIVVSVACLALAIFYAIPGPYHPFTFSGTPTGRHLTHAALFLVLAALGVIASRFVRSSQAA
jgi:hypothetical protein